MTTGPLKPHDKEVEGFGVSYDRHVMYFHQQILVRELELQNILEMPSFGAKAAPSLYSLGFAKAGCEVTITDIDEQMAEHWRELGLQSRLAVREFTNYSKTDFAENEFDLVWNFVTFTGLPNKDWYVQEMVRVSRRYVMLISCNNIQLGYPLHRLIHFLFQFPWNHGDTHYNYIGNVRKLMLRNGLKIHECGTIDSPPWPDPVGFRDVRLHKKGIAKIEYDWMVPVVDYIKKNKFPLWMNLLRVYDMSLRKGYWKLPFSHLFYVIGKKTA
jgi:hypothetical protein